MSASKTNSPETESKNPLLDEVHRMSDDTGERVCHKCSQHGKRFCFATIPWFITAMLMLYLVVTTIRSEPCGKGDFWKKYEFEPLRKEIPATLKQVKFDAALVYNESHHVNRPVTSPPYVGEPTPEIDAAWKELIGAVNVFVTPEEEHYVGENLYLDYKTGLYMAQVSAFHDLHCLNYIRKSIYPEYYTDMSIPSVYLHVEHCMDAIRLSLMCSADMTFVPIRWSDNRGDISPDFETVHTCRDYDALKDWSRGRDAADPELWPQNGARLGFHGN